MKTIGIIGVGNMGSALAASICRATDPKFVSLADTDQKKVDALQQSLGATGATLQQIATECDCILLAVKPQGMETLFTSLSPLLKARSQKPLLLSIAAGLSIATIASYLQDGPYPIVRMMPNTPAMVGEGVLLLSKNEWVTEDAFASLLSLLRYAGKTDCISESQMDAAGALSGCGPAFVCLIADALADGAVACGIPKEKALSYAWQTLKGTACLAQETGKHPSVLKDAVCSPGGTTIRGVSAMEAGGVRDAMIRAVCAAYQRSLELGKN